MCIGSSCRFRAGTKSVGAEQISARCFKLGFQASGRKKKLRLSVSDLGSSLTWAVNSPDLNIDSVSHERPVISDRKGPFLSVTPLLQLHARPPAVRGKPTSPHIRRPHRWTVCMSRLDRKLITRRPPPHCDFYFILQTTIERERRGQALFSLQHTLCQECLLQFLQNEAPGSGSGVIHLNTCHQQQPE